MISQQLGQAAEDFACQYLQTQGLQLLARHFRTRYGEIDLIMQAKEQVAFIEVRYRRSLSFGHPAETVTLHKQRKLIRAAQYYLHRHPTWQTIDSRFDIVAITFSLAQPQLEWMQNAFSVPII
jgi:putative endonuclease